ncbi:uncharacterized protein LOC108623411 [Ceratina calcarata]|uniref:Uncharacterized protein LOC108623411 n=1 Tax=Ceratina calcarata TaxID=156304 RepID=A0AAJ7N4N2_9HYME|nr:uncharacterized protein LOC108623411 [Ceratina calcarata]
MLRMLKAIRLVLNVSNLTTIKNKNNVSQSIKNNFVQCRTMYTGTSSTDDFATNCEKPKKRKTVEVPKITLLNQDESMRIVFLEEAIKIAKRQNLHLVHTGEDPKSGRSIYKLFDYHEILTQEKEIVNLNVEEQKFKHTKMFNLKSKIEEHDLGVKMAHMNKLLKKNHVVKVLVNHPTEGNVETVNILKKNILGTVSKEVSKKGTTILVFSPSSNEKTR